MGKILNGCEVARKSLLDYMKIMVYCIQANGFPHCKLRYRQLHYLHEILQKELPNVTFPSFPPKKILSLNSAQIEERKISLEKYILALTQESRVLLSHQFNGFFACAQHESYTGGGHIEEVPIKVFLMNGQKIVITATDAIQSHHLLQLVCKHIGLPVDVMNYFALFLVKKRSNELIVVKKLMPFECPYISQRSLSGSHRIVLRKNYWVSQKDHIVEDRVIEHPVALGLVYGQAVAEVQLGWCLCTDPQREQLAQLQATGHKKQYLELARSLPYYGYVQFAASEVDVPVPLTKALVAVGCNELSVRAAAAVFGSDDEDMRETTFRVDKIRCWRVSEYKTKNAVESSTTEAVSTEGRRQCRGEDSSRLLSSGRQSSISSSGYSSSGSSSSARCSSSNVAGAGLGYQAKDYFTLGRCKAPRDNGVNELMNHSNGGVSSIGGSDVCGSVSSDLHKVGAPCADLNAGKRSNSFPGRNCSASSGPLLQGIDIDGFNSSDEQLMMQLAFEFQQTSGEMSWVKIVSRQAVLMSLCLQSMVQQLVRLESGSVSPPLVAAVTERSVQYIPLEGSVQQLYPHSVKQPKSLSSSGFSVLGELSFRKLSERLAEFNGLSNSLQQEAESSIFHNQSLDQQFENSAFNNITDQHL